MLLLQSLVLAAWGKQQTASHFFHFTQTGKTQEPWNPILGYLGTSVVWLMPAGGGMYLGTLGSLTALVALYVCTA